MPYSQVLPNTLNRLASVLSATPNGSNVYLYKDSNGNINGSAVENAVTTNNTGYPFTYPDGTIIYTIPPLTSYASIPWDFTTSLTSTNLLLWIDAKETKSINQSLQKVFSKANGFYVIENTPTYSFTYSSNTIDLSSQGALESFTNQSVLQYFAVCMVISCPVQNLTNHTIFEHGQISLRIDGPRLAPDTVTTSYMISLYNNGVYKYGISFKPSDTTFKYIIYFNNSGNLQINGNVPSQAYSGTFAYGTTSKIYIGQNSSGTNNSQIKLHEIYYYQSSSNNITLTYSDFYSNLSSKWGLSTWVDNFNVPPILNPLTISTASMYWETGSSSGNNLLNFLTATTIFTPNNGASLIGSTLTVGSFTAKAGYINSPGGTNIYYNCSDNSLFPATIQDPFTLICILRASVDGRFWATSPIGGQLNNSMHNGGVISFSNGISNMQYNLPGNVNLTQSNFYIVSCAFSGGQYNTSTLSVRINGVTANNSYNGASTGGNSNITQNYIAWSVAGGGQSQCWAFFFAKSALSLSVIQKLESLMVFNTFTNASTTNILDASHPFKYASPTNLN